MLKSTIHLLSLLVRFAVGQFDSCLCLYISMCRVLLSCLNLQHIIALQIMVQVSFATPLLDNVLPCFAMFAASLFS